MCNGFKMVKNIEKHKRMLELLDFWAQYLNSHCVDDDPEYLIKIWKAFRALKWYAKFHAKVHAEGSINEFIEFLEKAFVYDLRNNY